MNTNRRLPVTLLSLLFLYYEVYRWVPLGRWNWAFSWPVHNDQFYPDIVIGLLLLLFIVSFVRSWRAGRWTCVVLLTLWVAVHVFDWWIPYATNSAANFSRYSFYAPHIQILPVIGNHYPPDAGHAVLDFLLFPTWLAVVIDIFRRHPKPADPIHA